MNSEDNTKWGYLNKIRDTDSIIRVEINSEDIIKYKMRLSEQDQIHRLYKVDFEIDGWFL